MEEVSGADLGWFFQQWLYRAGSPAVEGTWHYNAAAATVAIELMQTQNGEAYRLPLEIAVGDSTTKDRNDAKAAEIRNSRRQGSGNSDAGSERVDPDGREIRKTAVGQAWADAMQFYAA